MKSFKLLKVAAVVAIFAIFSIGAIASAGTKLSIGTSADKDGITEFHLALYQHYDLEEHSIKFVKKERLPDDEMAIAFFLAGHTSTSARILARLRLEGHSWMFIARRYGLTAEIFYIDVKNAGGPPYGKAYGHFRNKKRKAWRKMDLTDAQIIDLVNLRFLSEHYGYSVDEVIKMRKKGKSFVHVGRDIHNIKKQKRTKSQVAKVEKHEKKKAKKKKANKNKKKGRPQ